MLTPGVSVVKSACQTTGLMPPGRPSGAGRVAPARNTFPEKPDLGTVVSQVFVCASNVVVAVVTAGEMVITESGTAMEKLPLVMVASLRRMVTGPAPRPLTLPTLLNQTLAPAGMAVPLKVELM